MQISKAQYSNSKSEYCEKTKEIMILNWIKYNFINSRNTILWINKELKEVKNKEFVDKFYNMYVKLRYPIEEIEEVEDTKIESQEKLNT